MSVDEFNIINQYLKKLNFGNPEALDFEDDAALLPAKAGFDLVVTKDAIAESVHFFKSDPPADIAKKLLRVNLSDLAAKGAKPYCCFLMLAIPSSTSESWIKDFTSGLHQDLSKYGCFLAGGDTIMVKDGIVLSMTMLGHVPHNKMIKRSGAKIGDDIYVTGTIGDSLLGLEILKGGRFDLSLEEENYFKERYLLPEPRLDFSLKVSDLINAAADVSDGLIADLSNICNASKVAAELKVDLVPVLPGLMRVFGADVANLADVITHGDDYELVFTAASEHNKQIFAIAAVAGTKVTKIGKIVASQGVVAPVSVFDQSGTKITFNKTGFRHGGKS